MLDQTLTIILAGGVGSRLHPLTRDRAKPAVPFGGKYRIIDFSLTNCLHSGLRRVLVLTQYKSHSLQKHLRDGWSIFNPELGEYITTVPPQMRQGEQWYAGTADAIHQNLYLLERSGAKYVVILSGDHIYRMDYAPMLNFHAERQAEVTVACMQVPVTEAGGFGILQVNQEQRIQDFQEKPATPATLPDNPDQALASMGIYVFNIELLLETLKADHADAASGHDFGKNILPRLIARQTLFAYPFGGEEGRVTPDRYWRDVGTIDAFYDSNMDLLLPVPPLDLYQDDWSIRTYASQRPPARTVPGASGDEGIFINSIIAGGTVIAGGSVQHSVLFSKVYVGDEALVEDSLLFDDVHVGDGASLRHCIVDKDVRIPAGARIGHDPDQDGARFTVSDKGVVVVPKGYRFTN
ncbi:MAG: glucose-1-phosphate adenylyltransferase [Xanthomonadaceae bacterium]|nr:glucose-1-phosphate adenylyltransferase [Xanthomonadaceae bacterium]